MNQKLTLHHHPGVVPFTPFPTCQSTKFSSKLSFDEMAAISVLSGGLTHHGMKELGKLGFSAHNFKWVMGKEDQNAASGATEEIGQTPTKKQLGVSSGGFIVPLQLYTDVAPEKEAARILESFTNPT